MSTYIYQVTYCLPEETITYNERTNLEGLKDLSVPIEGEDKCLVSKEDDYTKWPEGKLFIIF